MWSKSSIKPDGSIETREYRLRLNGVLQTRLLIFNGQPRMWTRPEAKWTPTGKKMTERQCDQHFIARGYAKTFGPS